MAFDLNAAVQSLLTQGLDYAKVKAQSDNFRVNDPTGNVTGPNGTTAQVGQSFGSLGAVVNSVPALVWIGGAVLLTVLLLRR